MAATTDARKYRLPKGPSKSISDFMDDAARKGLATANARESLKWMADYTRQLKISPSQLIRGETDALVSRPGVGSMYFFFYDPKLKLKLPYYDRFPCSIMIEQYRDGFLGLNLHYLPYDLRARLLDALIQTTTNSRIPKNQKLRVSYQIVKSLSTFNIAKPAIKRYLSGHLRSRLIKVPMDEFVMAAFLPVQQFEKKTTLMVWNDSRRIMGNRSAKRVTRVKTK